VIRTRIHPVEAAITPASATGLRAFRWGLTVFVVLATSISLPFKLVVHARRFSLHMDFTAVSGRFIAYMGWSQTGCAWKLVCSRSNTQPCRIRPFLFHPFSWSVADQCAVWMRHWCCFLGAKSAGVVFFSSSRFFRYIDFLG